MNNNQAIQFNRMREALLRISKHYMTPDQIRRDSKGSWGLGYEESLEMSYENIQNEARMAVKGVRFVEAQPKKIKRIPVVAEGQPPQSGV